MACNCFIRIFEKIMKILKPIFYFCYFCILIAICYSLQNFFNSIRNSTTAFVYMHR